MSRPPARCFQDLIVWQKAHQFVLAVYRFSESFPQKEIYGLTSQFRRAAISIPAHIAEGFRIERQERQGSLYEHHARLCRGVSLLPDACAMILGTVIVASYYHSLKRSAKCWTDTALLFWLLTPDF
jgi:hypothetical protein